MYHLNKWYNFHVTNYDVAILSLVFCMGKQKNIVILKSKQCANRYQVIILIVWSYMESEFHNYRIV